MEKRRRARINASLTELKALLLNAIKREGARQNKMEKADILEMAVNHLRHIQRQQFTGESSNDTSSGNKYQLGFHACVQEVCTYLDSNSDEDLKLKTKLLNHLANCITRTDHQSTSSTSPSHLQPSTSSKRQAPQSPTSSSSVSPSLMPLTPELRLPITTPTSSFNKKISPAHVVKNVQKPKGSTPSCSESVQEARISSTPDGILHAVLTASSPTTLMKPRVISWLPRGVVLSPPVAVGGNQANTTTSLERHGQVQAPAVKEVNNNTIILPTVANIPASTSLSCFQQPSQLLPSYLCQQLQQISQLQQLINHPQSNQLQLQQQLNQSQLQQQLNQSQVNQINQSQLNQSQFNQTQLQQQLQQPQLQSQMASTFPTALLESSNIFSSANPLQLIPTKTANGEIAFLLSAANFTSNIPSFTIPVLAPPTLGHAQVVTSSQQALQIAVSCAQTEQPQSVAFIAPQFVPLINSANNSLGNISSLTTSQEATPLNLSVTSNQSTKLTNQQVSNQNFTPCSSATANSAIPTSSNKNVPSLPTATACSGACQSLLTNNLYNRPNTAMTSQIQPPSRDGQDTPRPVCLASQRHQEVRQPGLEIEDRQNDYHETMDRFLPIHQMGSENQWHGTERQEPETTQRRLGTERQLSDTDRQQHEREQRLIEVDVQHPETAPQRLKAERQRPGSERRQLGKESQQLDIDQRLMETERQRSVVERQQQETERQWCHTEIRQQETERHQFGIERQLQETDRQRCETERHYIKPDTHSHKSETERRLATLSEVPIFRPW